MGYLYGYAYCIIAESETLAVSPSPLVLGERSPTESAGAERTVPGLAFSIHRPRPLPPHKPFEFCVVPVFRIRIRIIQSFPVHYAFIGRPLLYDGTGSYSKLLSHFQVKFNKERIRRFRGCIVL